MKTRLKFGHIFDGNGCQIFEMPSALAFFSDRILDVTQNTTLEFAQSNPLSTVPEEQDFLDVTQASMELAEMDASVLGDHGVEEDLLQAEDELQRLNLSSRILVGTATASNENASTQGTQGTEIAEIAQMESGTTENLLLESGLAVNQENRPHMIIPFVPGTSDRLRKLAAQFGLGTWFAYPGKLTDMFTRFRGRVHSSKAQDTIYCVSCSCGIQYVGESGRNLKVRIAEHMRNSSKSALSYHLSNYQHKPILKHTQVLATEKNLHKRKIIESLCISNKKSRLCNTGVSVELPLIWQLCAPMVSRQLAKSD